MHVAETNNYKNIFLNIDLNDPLPYISEFLTRIAVDDLLKIKVSLYPITFVGARGRQRQTIEVYIPRFHSGM